MIAAVQYGGAARQQRGSSVAVARCGAVKRGVTRAVMSSVVGPCLILPSRPVSPDTIFEAISSSSSRKATLPPDSSMLADCSKRFGSFFVLPSFPSLSGP